MLEPADASIANADAASEESRAEASRLRAENARLRSENRELRATLDAYISRVRSTAWFGPCEMTAGTSVGARKRSTPERDQ